MFFSFNDSRNRNNYFFPVRHFGFYVTRNDVVYFAYRVDNIGVNFRMSLSGEDVGQFYRQLRLHGDNYGSFDGAGKTDDGRDVPFHPFIRIQKMGMPWAHV